MGELKAGYKRHDGRTLSFLPGPHPTHSIRSIFANHPWKLKKTIEREREYIASKPSFRKISPRYDLPSLNEPTNRPDVNPLPPLLALCPPLRPPQRNIGERNKCVPSEIACCRSSSPMRNYPTEEHARVIRSFDPCCRASPPPTSPFSVAHPRYRSRVFDYPGPGGQPCRERALHDVFNGTTRNFSR